MSQPRMPFYQRLAVVTAGILYVLTVGLDQLGVL